MRKGMDGECQEASTTSAVYPTPTRWLAPSEGVAERREKAELDPVDQKGYENDLGGNWFQEVGPRRVSLNEKETPPQD